jgi:DNA mismatch repair protein MutL
VLRYICFCWAQSHTFTHIELQHWFQEISTTQRQQLVDKFATAVALPAVAFSVAD